LKILLHDYAGHPFTVALARELARRGHDLVYAYRRGLASPRGVLTLGPDDPPGFDIVGVGEPDVVPRNAWVRRFIGEWRHGGLAAELVGKVRPDVVLSANTPVQAQARIRRSTARVGARFVFWMQDIYGIAIERIFARRLPLLGRLVAWPFARLERRLLRLSDETIVISPDFVDEIARWGVATDRVHVIENWGPIEDIPLRPRDNPWARRHLSDASFRFVYAGTLAMKHDPNLLFELARAFVDDPSVEVVVLSEGAAAGWLAPRASEEDVNLRVLPFQPFENVPEVLGSADVLVALLEPDAGAFSVPSKVLAYLCAGRPILAAIPSGNLAARLIEREQAGLAVNPRDPGSFVTAAKKLLGDPVLRKSMGEAGRTYAERTFAIGEVGDRFESLIAAISEVGPDSVDSR